ncbi:hypothetical protein SAMN05216276_10674 [Streptosporangium subroseum]|uniref:DUF7669 domain-containing protein n=1 Tax=Streptosporangium subroseum TaxID=106412 RepID=A0A239NRI7_9ACTN|nr:hypothetical protein [Streptosporangium subroseum]SNT57507.1 hypothetical protein SAMN05216276_10674 [Streptosporangium subroseum]
MSVWHGPEVWETVAAELRTYRRRGLGQLLTEDTVRFAAARALVDAGADPAGLRVEWPHPVLKGARVDLVAGGQPPAVHIEFKFPREPNEQNAAWTMVLGEVLKDFYRLATCPGRADRLFVYVETAQLRRYMAGAAQRYGLDLDVGEVALRPADVARLPMTAAQIIGADLTAHHVKARRLVLIDVDDALRLAVYEVDPLGAPPDPTAGRLTVEGTPLDWAATVAEPGGGLSLQTAGKDNAPELPTTMAVVPVGTRDGARREILEAIRVLLARSGGDTFTPAQVVAEMAHRGTGYAESTIRTMVISHMCRTAPDNAATTYDDLERVDRGVYRLVYHGHADGQPVR